MRRSLLFFNSGGILRHSTGASKGLLAGNKPANAVLHKVLASSLVIKNINCSRILARSEIRAEPDRLSPCPVPNPPVNPCGSLMTMT